MIGYQVHKSKSCSHSCKGCTVNPSAEAECLLGCLSLIIINIGDLNISVKDYSNYIASSLTS